jgi:hypothetical protein
VKAAACPLCGTRKGKRACPGLGGRAICSTCCGTKRRIEVDCPADCTYLTGAHASGWDGREDERRLDLMRVAPHLQALSQDEAALFFYLISGIVRVSSKHPDADDARWRLAVAALRRTMETRESGLVYEHKAEDFQADALVRDMRDVLEPRETEGRPVAPPSALRTVFDALAAALDGAAREEAGPRAFLETATRLAARIAAEQPATPPPAAPRLIEP